MISPPVKEIRWPANNEILIELLLTPDHPAFAGHFPGQPVLPGVVQIDWATQLSTAHFGVDLRSATDFRVKFRRAVSPDSQLSLLLRLDSAKSVLVFEYRRDNEVISNGQIMLPSTQ